MSVVVGLLVGAQVGLPYRVIQYPISGLGVSCYWKLAGQPNMEAVVDTSFSIWLVVFGFVLRL